MAADYSVVSTQKYSYVDDTNRVVDGYRVFFTMTGYHETSYILVPTLSPEAVKTAIERVVKDRKALNTL